MVELNREDRARIVKVPMSSDDVLTLRAGDVVSLSGRIVTGRDRVHKYLTEKKTPMGDFPFDLSGTVLYHCGPVMAKRDGVYRVLSAGPTTSMRVEMYEESVIKQYSIKGIMGKGGMGAKTLRALKESTCVYFHTVGGAAVYLADRIKNTSGVWKLDEFGPTEAMWFFEVEGFPAIVTMDAHGNDIHREIEHISMKKFMELIGK